MFSKTFGPLLTLVVHNILYEPLLQGCLSCLTVHYMLLKNAEESLFVPHTTSFSVLNEIIYFATGFLSLCTVYDDVPSQLLGCIKL